MNAISIYHLRSAKEDAVAAYDVDGCIRSWGRRGILSGGLLGLALGAIFLAKLSATDIFGTIGTLIVCVIECAVAGGGLGALLAVLNGHVVLRGNAIGSARTLTTGRPPSYRPMLAAAWRSQRLHGSSLSGYSDAVGHDPSNSSTSTSS